MADSKLTALPAITTLSLSDLGYIVDVSNTTNDPAGESCQAALNCQLALIPTAPAGRLGLENDVYVSTTNQTGKTVLYWNPAPHGGHIRLHDGNRWNLYAVDSPLSFNLAAAGLTSGKIYDVWGTLSGGSPALALSSAWTNDTTRADAIARASGVLCKSGDASKVLLGTICMTGNTTTEFSFDTTDAPARLFVWNAYNQFRYSVSVIDSTASWVYTSATIRQRRGSANNQIEWVSGGPITYDCRVANWTYRSNTGMYQYCGFGIDSTTVANRGDAAIMPSSVWSDVHAAFVTCSGVSALGKRKVVPLEWCDGNSANATWYGGTNRPLTGIFKL